VEQMMVAKAMEQAKRKEFETIERNEYNEIMNAQEDADEAKYWEQPKREPMLSDDHMNIMFASYGIGFAQYGDKVRKWYEAKIASGELMVVKTAKKVDVPILISSAHGGTWSTAPGCSECGRRWKPGDPFCGCGAKIIE